MSETRPEVKGYCKPCLGKNNLKPLASQEAISPRGVVHYGLENGDTLCGKDAETFGWWKPPTVIERSHQDPVNENTVES